MLSSSESHRRRSSKKEKDSDRDRDRTSPRTKDRDRDKDKDRERERDRDRDRHKSSHSSRSRKSRSSLKEDDVDADSLQRPSRERAGTSSSSHTSRSLRMAVVPEMERRSSLGSANASRSSLSYPSLSKTHAKENIYVREDADQNRTASTPDVTVVVDSNSPPPTQEKPSPPHPTRAAPPPPIPVPSVPPRSPSSPPEELRRTPNANSVRHRDVESVYRDMEAGRRSVDSASRMTPRGPSRSSIREDTTYDSTELTSTTGSQPSTVRAPSPKRVPTRTKTASPAHARPPAKRSSTIKVRLRPASEATLQSDVTSVPHRAPSPTNSETSPSSVVDSSPRTPTQHSVLPSVMTAAKERSPTVEFIVDPTSRSQSVNPRYSDSPMPPPPPPPPPPAPAMMDAPRVDYLLHNGGLPRAVPRSLLAAIEGAPVTSYSQYTSPRVSGAQTHDARSIYRPLQNVLNSYNAVMDSNGSLAVATGYRSVARRLLDRLENVFARNISSEYCQCLMCFEQPLPEEADGVNWGEILELVSGRCELPAWPPYDDLSPGLGISKLEDPCQRIDIDVPEQYREHYEKQSKKTKIAVQSWLSDQQENIPEDADDETLTFIMLTRLEQPQRPLYYALLWGLDKLPNPRTQKPDSGTPPYLSKAGLALQRLYRLHTAPRDQLTVMYLIRHPDMHNLLATLAAVTRQEWEILVSGRFDGFLWSGAEDSPGTGSTPPRSASRAGQIPSTDGPQRFTSPSPYSSRPGSTRPSSTRPGPAPVQMDEETEIAVLAEIEREIYLGMEAMEDAFEHLHNQAELVRRRLRERGAALSMVAQARRGSDENGIHVRMDTPASLRDGDEGFNDDLRSEIGPDDSASNVSHNRRRKAHRARERRTPAPVEEESEGESVVADRSRRRY